LPLALQKQDDRVRNLINLAKERGYVLDDEVNDILPPAKRTAAEIKSLFAEFKHHNIRVYENASAAKAARNMLGNSERGEGEERENPAHSEEVEIDETAHLVDKTSDPVRVYLREMGRVPLLKREGEVAIAKRMERGHRLVLRTISRSPLVIKELITIGQELRNGTRSIRESYPVR
jgi:RNA polymerase primary sigma factor